MDGINKGVFWYYSSITSSYLETFGEIINTLIEFVLIIADDVILVMMVIMMMIYHCGDDDDV